MSRAPAQRFLYMVVARSRHPLRSNLYTVHRINPCSLFFPVKNYDEDAQWRRAQSGPAAAAAAAAEIKASLPPNPILTLYPSAGDLPMNFVLTGRGKDKIVATDYLGRAFLYDDTLRAVSPLPTMSEPKYDPVCLATGDDLFVMSNPPESRGQSAEALADQTDWLRRSELHWRPVPTPPFTKPQPGGVPGSGGGSDQAGFIVDAYTVVGGASVWLSVGRHGTYSVDMEKIAYGVHGNDICHGEWSKEGDWPLPFSGRAVYAPERDLWFGFAASDQTVLCAADLKQQQGRPPVARHRWEGFGVPKEHCQAPVKSFLVHLGGTDGRFCVAKFSTDADGHRTARLTGFEVSRCVDGKDLCAVKHKTYHYGGFGDDDCPVSLL